mmetsp:Transcript_41906/g.125282  ORF Transcript_41906/g.125282 Transcript_41906/m.125282 type:complete len:239 (-) Transcript_41906:190-906(-)
MNGRRVQHEAGKDVVQHPLGLLHAAAHGARPVQENMAHGNLVGLVGRLEVLWQKRLHFTELRQVHAPAAAPKFHACAEHAVEPHLLRQTVNSDLAARSELARDNAPLLVDGSLQEAPVEPPPVDPLAILPSQLVLHIHLLYIALPQCWVLQHSHDLFEGQECLLGGLGVIFEVLPMVRMPPEVSPLCMLGNIIVVESDVRQAQIVAEVTVVGVRRRALPRCELVPLLSHELLLRRSVP